MSDDTGWAGPGGPGGYVPWGQIPVVPKPGVIPLHPLSVSEIIGGVFGTLKRHLAALYVPLLITAGLAAVPVGVLAVVAYGSLHGVIADFRAAPDYHPTHAQTVQLLLYGGLVLLVSLLGLLACQIVSATVSTAVLRHAVLGRKLTTRQAWAESRPYLWRVTCDTLLVGLALVLAVFVPFGLALAVALTVHSAVAFGLICLFILPAVGFVLYAQVRLVLAVPVVVLEDDRAVASLRRAWRLNEGAWWRSLGIPYLVGLIGSFAGQIVSLPFMLTGFVTLFDSMPPSSSYADGADTPFPLGSFLLFYLLLMTGSAASQLLTMPLAPLTNGLLYMDRRIRRESLDVALVAAAATSAPSSASAPSSTSA